MSVSGEFDQLRNMLVNANYNEMVYDRPVLGIVFSMVAVKHYQFCAFILFKDAFGKHYQFS